MVNVVVVGSGGCGEDDGERSAWMGVRRRLDG